MDAKRFAITSSCTGFDRLGIEATREALGRGRVANDQHPIASYAQREAGFEDEGARLFEDQRRPRDLVPLLERFPGAERNLDDLAPEDQGRGLGQRGDRCHLGGLGRNIARRRHVRAHLQAGGDRLHRVAFARVAEASRVGFVEAPAQRRELDGPFDAQGDGGLGAGVAQGHRALGPAFGGRGETLGGQDGGALGLELFEAFDDARREGRIGDGRCVEVAFAVPGDLRHPHPIGRQNAGEGMEVEGADPEATRDGAGVLAARTAEDHQRVIAGVVTARHRHLLDGRGHRRHRHLEEARSDGGRAPARLLREPGERCVHPRARQREGESLRDDAAEGEVDVGEGDLGGRRLAVAEGARFGSRALGAHREAAALVATDGAAAGGDGMDLQHRGAQADPRDPRLIDALRASGDPRDVGGGAPHVEADHLGLALLSCDAAEGHHAAGRARQDRVAPTKARGVRQAAAGLHDAQAAVGERLREAGEVAAQERRQVGIGDGGVAPPEKSDSRRPPGARARPRRSRGGRRPPRSPLRWRGRDSR